MEREKSMGKPASEKRKRALICELAAALAESKADLEAGRFVKESVEQHLTRILSLKHPAPDIAETDHHH